MRFLNKLDLTFVRQATRLPLRADIFVCCKVLDKLSVWENSRCPKFNTKKSEVFICAWNPMIFPCLLDWSFSSREILYSWRRAAYLSRIRWKQLARSVHLVGQRPSMSLASDSGPSRFPFISPRRFSRFEENFMRERISFALSTVSITTNSNCFLLCLLHLSWVSVHDSE